MSEIRINRPDAGVALPERRSNRPVTPGHYIELALMRGLIGFFRLMSVDAASSFAGKFARTIGPLIRPASKRAERNLANIYPDWPPEKIRAVTADIWENLGRVAGEFAHHDKFGPTSGRMEIEGKEILDRIVAEGRPVIFVTGHFANWELFMATLLNSGVNYGFVYRPANNPLTDELIIKHRAKTMSRYQIPKGKRGGRTLMQSLSEGRSVLMLVDQKLNSGISVPFMGKPAMTAPAAARLAIKHKAPVVYLNMERLTGAHFRMHVHEPMAFEPTGLMRDDIYNLTVKINQTLETDIHARPEQWLWFHRRWPKD
ncbi:lysophospholipid acyltransferase family protein [Hyphococcus flavus]|uniref:Lysophospholipid acyltransferase family protein n=1 Tax=Hyphococcus flavus TaxID=1866326 RepID=A0AAF0CEI5_9PROT|nr:lysophospholipid acyltransferase family protein [Hyphococcus flavus]WDI30239.1 lysophospholipid acyltransferase family protein [Hyphococcus flavus]